MTDIVTCILIGILARLLTGTVTCILTGIVTSIGTSIVIRTVIRTMTIVTLGVLVVQNSVHITTAAVAAVVVVVVVVVVIVMTVCLNSSAYCSCHQQSPFSIERWRRLLLPVEMIMMILV